MARLLGRTPAAIEEQLSELCLRRAIWLGCARKYIVMLNGSPGNSRATIASLGYFIALLDEVAQALVSNAYRECVDDLADCDTSESGAVIFVWHKQDDAASRAFVASLRNLSREEIPHAIIRLVFSFFESNFLSPQWWEGLPQEQKECLERRFCKDISGHDANNLVDDGLRVVNWTAGRLHEQAVGC